LGKLLFTALRGIGLVAFQTLPLMCAWAQTINPSDTKSVISTEEFYTKNKLTLVIDSAPGGGYDTYGRLLARFYGANIPGRPAVLVQNMPGAGGLTAVNWLAQVAPRDGSVIQIMSRSIPLAPLMGTSGARFDPLELSWIGSINRENIIAFSWHTTNFNTIDDLRKRTANVGVTGATADSALFTRLLNNLVGTRLNIISGYPGSDAINLAIERGENDIATGSWSSIRARKGDWLRDQKINVLVQFSLVGRTDLPGVPVAQDLVSDPDSKSIFEFFLAPQEMGRPLAAPPGIPAARLQALRNAFHATMADAQFILAAESIGADVDPISGEQILAILKRLYAMPPSLIERAKQAAQR